MDIWLRTADGPRGTAGVRVTAVQGVIPHSVIDAWQKLPNVYEVSIDSKGRYVIRWHLPCSERSRLVALLTALAEQGCKGKVYVSILVHTIALRPEAPALLGLGWELMFHQPPP